MVFRPPRWLRNGHVQTLMCAAPPYAEPSVRAGHPVEVEDLWEPVNGGEVLARAWWLRSHADDPARRRAPVAILVHGVGGADSSAYIRRATTALLRRGFHVWCMNLRGAGDSIARAPGLYHVGFTDDLRQFVTRALRSPEVEGVFIVGFSGGGNVALRLAAAWGDAAPSGVRRIASISAPLDLAGALRNMERLHALPYHFHVLRGLHRGARGLLRYRPHRAAFHARDLVNITSIRRFDEIVTVPTYGFANVESYYEQASAAPELSRVRIPSLLLHAVDDPMVPLRSIRPYLASASPAVARAFSSKGGHLGWIGGTSESAWIETWAMTRVLSFFA
jgi:hypothetical protein